MRIRTETEFDGDAFPVFVRAEFIEEPGGYAGSQKYPIGPGDTMLDVHSYAARELSNRPAVRVIDEHRDGYTFQA